MAKAAWFSGNFEDFSGVSPTEWNEVGPSGDRKRGHQWVQMSVAWKRLAEMVARQPNDVLDPYSITSVLLCMGAVCGNSLELLVKSVIVELGMEPRHTHTLKELLGQARISYDQSYGPLLDVWSHEVWWAGRYPAPKASRDRDAEDLQKSFKEHQDLSGDTRIKPEKFLTIWSDIFSVYGDVSRHFSARRA